MHVLILKNISNEGPGTIEEYLQNENIPYSTADLNKGDAAPSVQAFTHMVIMGGPMAVYEMDRYPHLRDEVKLIEQAVSSNKHVLGVCLGAQMLVHVLGARVYPGGNKEVGWHQVEISDDGMRDRLMAELAVDGTRTARVFQWHGDTFDLPAGSTLLASSELFPNQAFRYSDRVYALQFHIEVSPVIVHEWLKGEKGIDIKAVDTESNRIYEEYRLRAADFYRGFFKE
jgi:GMP synthase-like glutamine amidotransferase